MRIQSETPRERVLHSQWTTLVWNGVQYRVCIAQVEYLRYGRLKVKVEMTILSPLGLRTKGLVKIPEIGYCCHSCGTSDYIRLDRVNKGRDRWSQGAMGATCTRCGSATLQ